MRAKREFRDREHTEVAVLDALVNRNEDGMTVFELRAAVEADIDGLESALADLNDDGLIEVGEVDGRTVIKPADRVVPDDSSPEDAESFVDWLRERVPF